MFEMMTTEQFNQLLHMAVEEHQLDPSSTYVEITWWDKVYRPLVEVDCDRGESQCILVFGDDNCNTFCKNSDGIVVPTGFWIYKDAAYIEQVVHRPITVDHLIDSDFMLSFKTMKFLFSNSPINYQVELNPFKTRVFKNRGKETILALHVENRDSGEWQPFSQMTSKRIQLVDDNPKPIYEGDR